MAATVTYNICFCSESESGSGVSDAIEEGHINQTLRKEKEAEDAKMMTTTTIPSGLDLSMEAERNERISEIKKKYILDAKSQPDGKTIHPPLDGPQTRDINNLHAGRDGTTKKIDKSSSEVRLTSGDSDTMQEEGEVSSTTIQELDQAWDVYQEPLYATGSDVTEEERLDPSSLIEDWDGSMEEEVTVHENMLIKGGLDWSEDSDTEDISRLIEDSKMQLKIIREVVEELTSNYMEVSRSDYIESFATCQTNIRCLENLLAALNKSMGDRQADNEHVTLLKELHESWQMIYKQLDRIERPEQLGQKNKVRKRLRKKKIFRKFSCDVRGGENDMDPEREASFPDALSANRSGSLPEVEFIDRSNGDFNGNRKKFFAENSSQKVEGDTKLMSALFFGLIILILILKIAHSYFAEVDIFSFDVSFFVDYLRENPPA